MDGQDLGNDGTKESRLEPILKKADRCGVKVQLLHTLPEGPHAKHVSEPLFIHLYMNSVSYLWMMVKSVHM